MLRVRPTSLLGLSFSVLLTPLAVLAPTVTSVRTAHAHPVAPALHRLPVAGVDPAALRGLPSPAAGQRTLALTKQERTAGFSLVGVTWEGADAPGVLDVQIRTRTGGHWTDWHDVGGTDDVAPDAGSRDARQQLGRAGTAPYWVGPSDGVQVRVDGKRAPHGLRVELVDPGSSGADAALGQVSPPGASAEAAVSQPPIVSRKGWGADESLRDGSPDYAPPIKVGFVHHTDTTNSYTASQSASIVRSIYAYHTKGRGWSDIGYNFLIDKYGTIFEGRYGGIDKAVIGAHTGGFNSHSFAASLMGNYATATPSSKMLTSLEKLFAWKFQLSYLNPLGYGTLVSSGGGTSRYSAGTSHTFNAISGHRDAGYTTCPGGYVYSKLSAIRSAVRSYMGPSFVAPSVAPATRGLLDKEGFTVKAGAVNALTWTLTVTEATTGAVVRTLSGTASPSAPVNAVWDRFDAEQVLAPPGEYQLRLDATSSDGRTAKPWSTRVKVTSPITLKAPSVAAWNSTVPVSGTAPAGADVQLEGRKLATTDWLPVAQTKATSTGTFTSSVLLDDDYDLRATTGGYPSETRRLRVAPMFSAPADLPLGATLTLQGTSRPGSVVTVQTRRPSATTWTTAGTPTADPLGAWTFNIPMSGNWAVQATSAGVSTPVTTVWVRPTLTTTADLITTLNSPVPVSGTAAPADQVTLQVQRTGTSTWTNAGSALADSSGKWSGSVPLTDDVVVRASAHGRPSLETRAAHVRPTAKGPAKAAWNSTVTLTGTARPGRSVTVSRTTGGQTANVTTTASSSGNWSAPFTLSDTTTWSATSGGLASSTGTTAAMATLAVPPSAVVSRGLKLSGTAVPGSSVTPAVHPPGATYFSALPAATADPSTGAWSATYYPPATGAYQFKTQLAGTWSDAKSSAVVASTVVAPAKALLRSVVKVTGVARAGATVRLETNPRSIKRWAPVVTVTAGSTGAWSASFVLTDDTWVRVTTPDGTTASVVTRVAPTYSAPRSAPVNSTITLRGTARPGASVALYVRYAWESTPSIRARATVSSTGTWSVRWTLKHWMASYALTDGRKTVTLVTSAQ